LNKAKTEKQKTPRKQIGATFDTVRELALALPGVEEATSYRTHTFRTNGRMLARFREDGESLLLKADYTAREVLTGAQPDMFYVTDHYRCWPLMLVRLKNVDVDLLCDLIEEAWRGLARKRAIAEYEAKRR
jgi:hypothetical protein